MRSRIVRRQNSKQSDSMMSNGNHVISRSSTHLLSKVVPDGVQILSGQEGLSGPFGHPFLVQSHIVQGEYRFHALPFSMPRSNSGSTLAGVRSYHMINQSISLSRLQRLLCKSSLGSSVWLGLTGPM